MDAPQRIKITSKNTWSFNTIETFQTDHFFEHNHINFNKASSMLNTCIQIYASRVDDISNTTLKLLSNFESFKKKRKRENFTSEDLYLKIENEANERILESNAFLQRSLQYDGFLTLFSREESGISFIKFLGKKKVCIENKKVCPGIEHFENFRNIEYDNFKEEKYYENTENEKFNNEILYDGNNLFDDNNEILYDDNNEIIYDDNNLYDSDKKENILNDNNNILNDNNILCDNENLSENSDYDFTPVLKKGWAGPNYWNIKKKNNKNFRKKEEKKVFDFTKNYDCKIVYEKGKNSVDPQVIKERRKVFYFLPEDLNIKREDLYKFILRNEFFYVKKREEKQKFENNFNANDFNANDLNANELNAYEINANEINNINFNANETNNYNANENLIVPQEIITDMNNIKNIGIAKNILLKYTKIPKKVDIKKLKDEIYDSIIKKENLVDLCKNVVNENLNKDVSIHFCLVSVLHLANEKNLLIEGEGNFVTLEK